MTKKKRRKIAGGRGDEPRGPHEPVAEGASGGSERALFALGRALPGRGTVCHSVSADGSDYFYLKLGEEWQAAAPHLSAAAASTYAGRLRHGYGVILTPPCILHSQFSIRNTQANMRTT